MPPKKKSRTESASWECEGDEGWEPFAAADTTLLEEEYIKGNKSLTTGKLSFNKGYKTQYTFDFSAMTQCNNDSKKQRKIRRVAPVAECQWEFKDDSGLFVPFYDDDSTEIERLYALFGAGSVQKTKKLTFNKGYDTMYSFSFAVTPSPDGDATKATVTGSQKNEDSGKIRELRRIQKKLPWKTEGYGISGAKLPTPAELAALAAAPTATDAAPSATAATASAPAAGGEPLLTRAATLSIPAHWTAKAAHVFDASGAHSQVIVPPGSEEYNAIAGCVTSTIGKSVSILKVLRIENVTLWTFYALTRDQIAKRYGGNPSERLLFYGERNAKNVQTIHQFGFDTRVAEDGLFGIGLYFGVHAKFCDSGRCLQNKDGSKDVLVCRAALGSTTKGAKSIRRPPPKDPKKPTVDLYDACSDDKDPHELFVLFNNSQVYPEYVVTYK